MGLLFRDTTHVWSVTFNNVTIGKNDKFWSVLIEPVSRGSIRNLLESMQQEFVYMESSEGTGEVIPTIVFNIDGSKTVRSIIWILSFGVAYYFEEYN